MDVEASPVFPSTAADSGQNDGQFDSSLVQEDAQVEDKDNETQAQVQSQEENFPQTPPPEPLHALLSLAIGVMEKINTQMRKPAASGRMLWQEDQTRAVSNLCKDATALLYDATYIARSTSIDHFSACPLTVFGCNRLLTLTVVLQDGSTFDQPLIFLGAQSTRERQRNYRASNTHFLTQSNRSSALSDQVAATEKKWGAAPKEHFQKQFEQQVMIPCDETVCISHLSPPKGAFMALPNLFGRARFYVMTGIVDKAMLTSPDGTCMHYVGGPTQTLYLRSFKRRHVQPAFSVKIDGHKQLMGAIFGRRIGVDGLSNTIHTLTFHTSDNQSYRFLVRFRLSSDTQTRGWQATRKGHTTQDIFVNKVDDDDDNGVEIYQGRKRSPTDGRELEITLPLLPGRRSGQGTSSLRPYININNSSKDVINVTKLFASQFCFCCLPASKDRPATWFTAAFFGVASVLEHFEVVFPPGQACPISIDVSYLRLHFDNRSGQLCSAKTCCSGTGQI